MDEQRFWAESYTKPALWISSTHTTHLPEGSEAAMEAFPNVPVMRESTIVGKPGAQKRTAADVRDQLTPREVEILELLAKGMSNKDIGDRLFLTEKTVKHYVTNILQKLQVHNRVEAALLAQKSRWFQEDE